MPMDLGKDSAITTKEKELSAGGSSKQRKERERADCYKYWPRVAELCSVQRWLP